MVCRAKEQPTRAVVLMAAADSFGGAEAAPSMIFPDVAELHDDCEGLTRNALGDTASTLPGTRDIRCRSTGRLISRSGSKTPRTAPDRRSFQHHCGTLHLPAARLV